MNVRACCSAKKARVNNTRLSHHGFFKDTAPSVARTVDRMLNGDMDESSGSDVDDVKNHTKNSTQNGSKKKGGTDASNGMQMKKHKVKVSGSDAADWVPPRSTSMLCHCPELFMSAKMTATTCLAMGYASVIGVITVLTCVLTAATLQMSQTVALAACLSSLVILSYALAYCTLCAAPSSKHMNWTKGSKNDGLTTTFVTALCISVYLVPMLLLALLKHTSISLETAAYVIGAILALAIHASVSGVRWCKLDTKACAMCGCCTWLLTQAAYLVATARLIVFVVID